MNDTTLAFLAGFVIAWCIQALRGSFSRFVGRKFLAHTLRERPTDVMRALQQLRDSE